jgi:protoporphyrinogen oxidase
MLKPASDKVLDTSVAILGAGPAGLGAAYMLAQRGISVVVLEQLDRVGGNAGSFEIAGIPVDFGSHRLHPASDPAILEMIRKLTGDDLLQRPRHGRIRLMGRWLHFPLKAGNLVLNAPPRFALGVAGDLAAKLLPRSEPADENFASILRRGLGATICDEFYFPYARKIWGMEPLELSPIQAYKRVSSGSIGKMLKKLLPGLPGKSGAVPKGIFYYPRGGFGQISQSFCEAATEAGADIRTGTKVRRVMPEAGGYRVEFKSGDWLQTLNTRHIWSTIPITVLTRLIEPAAPEDVISAARSLRFRGMLLIYLVLDTQQFTPFDAHYLPAANIRITRLSEPKNYAARTEPLDTTVLCAELPCQPGDEVWALDETALGQLVLEDLAQAGIPVECEVRQVVVKRLPQAYPLYPVGFENAFNLLDTWVQGLSNILSFGRQGLYAHDNTHHALYMAAAAVRCLGGDGAFDHDEWAREREVFATHVVED